MTSCFKCYVDHSHTMYSSGNIDVRNWVSLFESRCIFAWWPLVYIIFRQNPLGVRYEICRRKYGPIRLCVRFVPVCVNPVMLWHVSVCTALLTGWPPNPSQLLGHYTSATVCSHTSDRGNGKSGTVKKSEDNKRGGWVLAASAYSLWVTLEQHHFLLSMECLFPDKSRYVNHLKPF